jgi:anti-sigma B factor antagonist
MVARSTVSNVVKTGTHLDVRNVASVRAKLNALLEATHQDCAGPVIVLDMDGLELIDAAGLGMLTAAHLRAERAGQRLVLRNCSKEIRRVLAVTRLNRILHLDRSHLELSA